jgi:hypothetical protein
MEFSAYSTLWGYLHVVPRIAAQFVVHFAVDDHAAAMSALACITVACIAVVFHCSKAVVPT